MKKERSSNFELLRIIAILMVITSHFCLFSGLAEKIPVLSFQSIFIYGLRVGVIANYIFVLITGYFMVKSSIKYEKIIALILQAFIYSILILIIVKSFKIIDITTMQMIKSFFPIFFGNWFIIYYILLYLLIPFINIFIKNLNKKEFKNIIMLLLIINFIIPTFTKNIWNYTYHDFFITSYLIGAYLRLHCENRFKNNKKIAILILAMSVFGFLSVYVLEFLGYKFNIISLSAKPEFLIRNSYSIFPITYAILLVLLFRNIKMKNHKFINYISSSTLGVYLIHENFLLRNLIWGKLFIFNYSNHILNIVLFMVIKVFMVFIVCLVIDKLIIILFDKIINNFSKQIYLFLEKVYLKIFKENEKSQRKYKTEFHIHTRYSKDSILSYWLLLLVAKKRKIDTLVITDHNEITGAVKFKEKFKKHNIEIIVGEEIFTKKGEIIGLNLKERIEPNLTPKQTIKEIRKQGGLVYIPHPYDEKRYKTVLSESEIEKNKDEIDFIEVHNGRNIDRQFSIEQNEIAENYGLRKIIGSDAHTFFELGKNYILTDKKITNTCILENYNNVNFIKSDCINFAHKWTKVARIIKMIGRGDFGEIFRTINRKCKRK